MSYYKIPQLFQKKSTSGGGPISVGTVSFVNEGSTASGSTSLSVPLPGSRVVGNIMILLVVNKYPPNGGTAAPSGWTAFTNNQSVNSGLTAGVDNGNMRVTMFYRIIAGGESGNVAVTMTSVNVGMGVILQFSKSGGTWNLAAAIGADNTHNSGSPTVMTMGSDPDIRGGDMVLVGVGINTDTGAAILGESIDITVPGVTLGTIIGNTDSSTTGNDMRMLWVYAPASSGTSSGAPTYEHEITVNSAGSAVLLRLRALL